MKAPTKWFQVVGAKACVTLNRGVGKHTMTEKDAEKVARGHLATMLELTEITAPHLCELQNPSWVEECHWFSFSFPGECWIGAGWVIAVRKSDGSVAYFGTDGGQ